MEPTIKGWVWVIPFYPRLNNNRTLQKIFWYDSSNDLEFTKHTEEYQIVVPENCINASVEQIRFVHHNLETLIKEKQFIIVTDDNGNFFLNVPDNIKC
jgi:predicted  nucleic acid-binding Zn-ribbon protein